MWKLITQKEQNSAYRKEYSRSKKAQRGEDGQEAQIYKCVLWPSERTIFTDNVLYILKQLEKRGVTVPTTKQ